MKRLKWISLALTFLVFSMAGAAQAQEKKAESSLDPQALFSIMDRNQDEKIHPGEYLKVWKDQAEGERAFRQLDKNNDGSLSREEFGLPGLTILRW